MPDTSVIDVNEVIKDLEAETGVNEAARLASGTLVGEYVVVRCHQADAHTGVLEARVGTEVTLTESRRLWYWPAPKGAVLSGIAVYGLGEGSMIGAELERIIVLDACEVIATTAEAEKSIREYPTTE